MNQLSVLVHLVTVTAPLIAAVISLPLQTKSTGFLEEKLPVRVVQVAERLSFLGQFSYFQKVHS